MDATTHKMRALEEGAAAVVERGHTVILGWTDETPIIIRELAKANASSRGGVVVVLDEAAKTKLDKDCAARLAGASLAHQLPFQLFPNSTFSLSPPPDCDLAGTRVIFRSGSRLRVSDLARVSVHTCRAIILLPEPGLPPALADAEALQAVLNLSTLGLDANVVAAVRGARPLRFA